MAKRKRYGYIIHKDKVSRNDEFLHLSIEVIRMEDYMSSDNVVVRFTWQGDNKQHYANKNKDDFTWYGFSAEPRRRGIDSVEHLNEFASVTRRIMKDQNFYDFEPATLVSLLEGKKMPRVVYDSRLSHHVLVDDLVHSDYNRWLDHTHDQCVVSVMATDENHAKAEILKEFGKQIENGRAEYYAEKMMEWLAADKPVRSTAYGHFPQHAPEVLQIDELLNLS